MPEAPRFGDERADGTKQLLDKLGPKGFADWMLAQKRALVTDTTMRDAHQSLLATRMRSYDIVTAAKAYSVALPQLFSLECWGGATFDVSMRFLSGRPVGPPDAAARTRAEYSAANAAARRQRRRLHQLSG